MLNSYSAEFYRFVAWPFLLWEEQAVTIGSEFDPVTILAVQVQLAFAYQSVFSS